MILRRGETEWHSYHFDLQLKMDLWILIQSEFYIFIYFHNFITENLLNHAMPLLDKILKFQATYPILAQDQLFGFRWRRI